MKTKFKIGDTVKIKTAVRKRRGDSGPRKEAKIELFFGGCNHLTKGKSMKREQAKKLAQFYFSLLADKAGVHWDNDNVAEIDELINCIIDAAKEEIIKEFENRLASLESITDTMREKERKREEQTNGKLNVFESI